MEARAVDVLRSEDVRALAGQRATWIGTYRRTTVSKRAAPEPDPTSAGTARLELEGGAVLMLEVYYDAAGWRPAEEVRRCHGRRVAVTGVLYAATPTQTHDGIPMATMIGPYVGQIEAVELVGP